MKISLNFDKRKIVDIYHCINIEYLPNTGIFMLYFDDKVHRDVLKYELSHNIYVDKMQCSDNSDYPDLPECYKIYFFANAEVDIRVSNQ